MANEPRSKTPRTPDSPSDVTPGATATPPPPVIDIPEHDEPALWALAGEDSGDTRELRTVEEIRAAMEGGRERLWVDVESAPREMLLELTAVLGLHPLITEDILERNQRAKVELYSDALHMVMFGLSYEGEIVSHELDIVLAERYLLTAHGRGIDPRHAPFMRRDNGSHIAAGPDYVLYAIADWIVDGYFPVFDKLGDEIDDLQVDVMRKPSKWVVERLFQVRRDLLHIRHAVSPQREIFNQLTNRDMRLIDPHRIVYFRDVYDHLIRLTDELDSYRELVSTTLDIYVSQVNNNLSEIMKRLTAVTAVLAGIGALAGIFGMSEAGLALTFEDVRFWYVTAAILISGVLGIVYFRRIGWL